jgi:hypothetical protein
VHSSHIKHQFFHHKVGVCEQVLDLLHSNTKCSENSPLHVRKTMPHQRKTVTMDQLFHRIKTKETDYKNVFLQPDHVPTKHQLLMSYMVSIVTILCLFIQTFFKHSPLELRNFLQHFPADSYLKYSCTKTDGVQQSTSADACCYITDG